MNLSLLSGRLIPSIATSVVAHAALLGLGLVSLRAFHQATAFPVDAVEISAGEFLIERGVNRVERKRQAAEVNAPSKVEMETERSTATTKKAQAIEDQAASQGQGGLSAARSGAVLSEWDQYRVRVRERILEALVYPRASKNLGESGAVKVKLTILRDGTLSEVSIAEPSAFGRLNVAALDTVKRVAQFEPFPPSYAQEVWSAIVPIDFALK
jgi:TonB family protein